MDLLPQKVSCNCSEVELNLCRLIILMVLFITSVVGSGQSNFGSGQSVRLAPDTGLTARLKEVFLCHWLQMSSVH